MKKKHYAFTIAARVIPASAACFSGISVHNEAEAAEITVGPGCTLFQAIEAANTDFISGTCTPGFGADNITLPADSEIEYSTYINNYGRHALPVITSDITISGNDSVIRRSAADGTPTFRFFQIRPSASLTLDDLTLENGVADQPGGTSDSGGAILNISGDLTLNNSVVSGNFAYRSGGAIYQYAGQFVANDSAITNNNATIGTAGLHFNGMVDASINRSEISGNHGALRGGGLYMTGSSTASVTESVISGNTTAFGGGISCHNSSCDLSIIRSSITGNTATESGGGVYNDGSLYIGHSTIASNSALNRDGGGVVTAPFRDEEIEIVNSTISGNYTTGTGGGVLHKGQSPLTIRFSTIEGNSASRGDGIAVLDDEVMLYGSVVSHSTGGGPDDIFELGGTLVQDVTTLVHDTHGDPLLAPLSGNGGIGATHLLFVGSPAIDNAGDCSLATDQRDAGRPVDGDESGGAECDSGAFERQQPAASISFTASGFIVNEDDVTGQVDLVRSNGYGESSVDIVITGGTAESGADFDSSAFPLTVAFSDGETSASISVDVIDDDQVEGDESIDLALDAPSFQNAVAGAQPTTTLTIEDNEVPLPTVSFATAEASLPESAGSGSIIAVQLSSASTEDVLVPFTISGGSAQSGVDFTIDTPSPLVIPAGSLSATVFGTIIDDTIEEIDETVLISMGTPTNATQGAVTEFSGTIIDNDQVVEIEDDDDGDESSGGSGGGIAGIPEILFALFCGLAGLYRRARKGVRVKSRDQSSLTP